MASPSRIERRLVCRCWCFIFRMNANANEDDFIAVTASCFDCSVEFMRSFVV